jgi:hypothetical protein
MNDTVVTRTHPFIASALGKMRLSQQAQPGGRLRMYERGEHLGRRNATGNSTLLAQAADEEGRHYAQARAPHCHRHSTHTRPHIHAHVPLPPAQHTHVTAHTRAVPPSSLLPPPFALRVAVRLARGVRGVSLAVRVAVHSRL